MYVVSFYRQTFETHASHSCTIRNSTLSPTRKSFRRTESTISCLLLCGASKNMGRAVSAAFEHPLTGFVVAKLRYTTSQGCHCYALGTRS